MSFDLKRNGIQTVPTARFIWTTLGNSHICEGTINVQRPSQLLEEHAAVHTTSFSGTSLIVFSERMPSHILYMLQAVGLHSGRVKVWDRPTCRRAGKAGGCACGCVKEFFSPSQFSSWCRTHTPVQIFGAQSAPCFQSSKVIKRILSVSWLHSVLIKQPEWKPWELKLGNNSKNHIHTQWILWLSVFISYSHGGGEWPTWCIDSAFKKSTLQRYPLRGLCKDLCWGASFLRLPLELHYSRNHLRAQTSIYQGLPQLARGVSGSQT